MTTFFVDTEEKPDVLARVVMLFHRRAIPIVSFSMAPTNHPGVIRMAIATEISQIHVEHVIANLYKIVNVLIVKTEDQDHPLSYV